ncbi:hypothetical protein CICLE_v10028237mg [Citrus x clementina]|uniref:F-box domain-containing protein n=1 Tax=Citrus clementina TaxID=85681 RepID=V4SBF7_CITCL|nr:F-box protein At3g07870 [Citrus x clementina]ESR36140.1 hypothetical protein CICLE_v10028237mg [Citrus x clementina]
MSDYLPDEVLANIFFKLPAKTVLDCRCVCKVWCSIISDSNFLSNYNKLSFNNNKNNKRLLLSHYDSKQRKEIFTLHSDDKSFGQKFEELELPFDHGLSNYMIIGFCCGLVCLLEISKAGRSPESILFWNPSVGYSFKPFPIEPPVGRILQPYARRGYGPSIKFNGEEAFLSCFGFGFDPKSNDYKVVRIVYRLENTCEGSKRVVEVVDVFTLGTGEWENITESAPSYVIKQDSAHVCVNGALHWIGYYEGSDERLVSQLIIAVFDLNDEVFKEFKLPDNVMREANELGVGERQKISVGLINESLALIHYHTNANTYVQFFYRCCIWVMNEHGVAESWTKLYDVHSHLGLGKILGLRRNGEVLVGTVEKGKLSAINPKGGRRSRNMNVRGEPWSFYMDAFMECLIIYKKVNGVPTMSTYSGATTSRPTLGVRTSSYEWAPGFGTSSYKQALGFGTSSYEQALGAGTSGVKMTEKGKEIIEEEEEEQGLWLDLGLMFAYHRHFALGRME